LPGLDLVETPEEQVMSNINIFKNSASSIPTSDAQIVRVDLDKSDIGGRKSALPAQERNSELSINHVPNAGTAVGK
jgi:hypothetical protein